MADLNGVTTATMRACISELEKQTGEKLVFSSKAKAIKKTMKKQKIDHAKVVELYLAGKSVKEIATEMQTYEQNIYNHIAKYKKEKAAAAPAHEPAPEQTPRDEAADKVMVNVVLELMGALEADLIDLEAKAAPLRYQLNKWRKVKEAIENDTL